MSSMPLEAIYRKTQKGEMKMLISASFFVLGVLFGICLTAILSAAKCADCQRDSEFNEMEGRRNGK